MYMSVVTGHKKGPESLIEGCLSDVLDLPEVMFFETDFHDMDQVFAAVDKCLAQDLNLVVIPMLATKENYDLFRAKYPAVPVAHPFLDCPERDGAEVAYFMDVLPKTVETAKFYAGIFVLQEEQRSASQIAEQSAGQRSEEGEAAKKKRGKRREKTDGN